MWRTVPVILFSRGVLVVTLAFFAAIQHPVQKLLDAVHSEQVELVSQHTALQSDHAGYSGHVGHRSSELGAFIFFNFSVRRDHGCVCMCWHYSPGHRMFAAFFEPVYCGICRQKRYKLLLQTY